MVYEPAAAVIHGHERTLWGEFQFAVDNAISLKRMGILDDPRLGSELHYGLACLREDLKYFAHSRQLGCACRTVINAAAKWAGVQFGKREKAFPRALMKRLSMNMKTLDG